MDARDLIPGFEPESELEDEVTQRPEMREGLAWGKPRRGHPEGSVGTHVGHLLEEIEESGETGPTRAMLRFIALVHDAFKYKVRDRLPKAGENHHAMRARRFAEKFTDDERLLTTIELHDRPYALWRKLQRKGRLDERGFQKMLERIEDPDLFLRFIEIDGSTEGKRGEPIEWFREELRRRGVTGREAARLHR